MNRLTVWTGGIHGIFLRAASQYLALTFIWRFAISTSALDPNGTQGGKTK
jgi:hypothetical protein